MRAPHGRRAPPARSVVVPALYFTLGLLCRLVVFTGGHTEGDELVYQALVLQLEYGFGYTLIGSPLMDRGWPADQYGKALFFHPPGGIALFWLLHRVIGDLAFPVAQVLVYALFFWSMMSLARGVFGRLEGLRLHAVALLAAFTPIMTHVVSRFWIDGPMLAFATLAAALYVRGLRERSRGGVVLAALVMGYASWIKTAALVMLPGLLALGAALPRFAPGGSARDAGGGWGSRPASPRAAPPEAHEDTAARASAPRLALAFALIAIAVQLPWELWQWRVVGNPFPAWAGKPSPELMANNQYVYALTVTRPPWMYLTLLPRAAWTLLPSIAGLALPRLDARARRIGLALLLWISVVLAVVIGLGAIGYSKLLRYAVLVTPATVLLCGLTAGEAWRRMRDPQATPRARRLATVLVGCLIAGLALEVAQGLYTPLVDRHRDLIVPILLPAGGVL